MISFVLLQVPRNSATRFTAPTAAVAFEWYTALMCSSAAAGVEAECDRVAPVEIVTLQQCDPKGGPADPLTSSY